MIDEQTVCLLLPIDSRKEHSAKMSDDLVIHASTDMYIKIAETHNILDDGNIDQMLPRNMKMNEIKWVFKVGLCLRPKVKKR